MTNVSTTGILWRLESTEISFRPGLCPGPCWESLQCSPWSPSWLGGGNPLPIFHPLDAFGVL